LDLPVFLKRRFQHGAVDRERLRRSLTGNEPAFRRQFLAQYGV
jgi:hypothetical protein